MKLTSSIAGLAACGVPTLGGLSCTVMSQQVSFGPIIYSNYDGMNDYKAGVNGLLVENGWWNPLDAVEIVDVDWQSLTPKFEDSTGYGQGCVSISWEKKIWS